MLRIGKNMAFLVPILTDEDHIQYIFQYLERDPGPARTSVRLRSCEGAFVIMGVTLHALKQNIDIEVHDVAARPYRDRKVMEPLGMPNPAGGRVPQRPTRCQCHGRGPPPRDCYGG